MPPPTNHKESWPARLARRATDWSGSTAAFLLAVLVILAWLVTGPVFGFSDTWQLVINTGTTIVTFLMVFLIQRAQNKDSQALHLKLNELVAATKGASNRLINVEGLTEEELKVLHEHYGKLVELAKAEVGKSAKKAGIGGGAFGAALVMVAFSAFFFGIAVAEFLTWLGLERWIYLIVWFLLILLAGVAALFGMRTIKKIEKPERTMETLRDLPDVMRREPPGARHRDVPVVSNGKVSRRPGDNYQV